MGTIRENNRFETDCATLLLERCEKIPHNPSTKIRNMYIIANVALILLPDSVHTKNYIKKLLVALESDIK